MPKSDQELFEEFKKHHAVFEVLVDAGVFNARNSQVVMNFNHEGYLMNVEIKMQVYKRLSKNLTI